MRLYLHSLYISRRFLLNRFILRALLGSILLLLLCQHLRQVISQLGYQTPQNPVHATPEVSADLGLLATPLDFTWQAWVTHNHEAAHALYRCTELSNCAANQTKVVIIESHHFRMVKEAEWTGGEGVWAASTLRALEALGCTVLFSISPESTLQLYHLFHNLIKMVLCEEKDTLTAWDNSNVRSHRNPTGIPAWKMFSYSFWAEPANLLGPKWTLSPEDYRFLGRPGPSNTYLGYSIEQQCAQRPYVPPARRHRQAWILAKSLAYFLPARRAWDPALLEHAARETGISFLTGAGEGPDPARALENDMSASLNVTAADVVLGGGGSVDNVGPLEQADFLHVLSKSLVLVGMGEPFLSPTPYDALCLGVPFINPILDWDRANPTDRTGWHTQHDALRDLHPPYVYHVFKGNRGAFVQALKDAGANPIQSYVPERMRMSAIEQRLGAILEHDWRREAEEVLGRRQASGEGMKVEMMGKTYDLGKMKF